MTVIGVMPAGFTGPDQFVKPAFYVPFAIMPVLKTVGTTLELTSREVRQHRGQRTPEAGRVDRAGGAGRGTHRRGTCSARIPARIAITASRRRPSSPPGSRPGLSSPVQP